MQYRCLRNYSASYLKSAQDTALLSHMCLSYEQDIAWLNENLGEYGQRWSVDYRSVALVTYLFAEKEDLVLFKLARGDHG